MRERSSKCVQHTRRRFKIPREKVLSEVLEFAVYAAPSPYDIDSSEDELLGKCRLSVANVQGVVASFPERSKEQKVRVNMEGHVEQLLDAVPSRAASLRRRDPDEPDFDRRPILQVECSYGYVSGSGPPHQPGGSKKQIPLATKNKSAAAREAKEKALLFVSDTDTSHTAAHDELPSKRTTGARKAKMNDSVVNMPGEAQESHWVDIAVLSVRSVDVEICKKYTKLRCSVVCVHTAEKFTTAWGTSTFHTERVKQARRDLGAKGYKQNRSHQTLDYLTREMGKTPLDLGATFNELKKEDREKAYQAWLLSGTTDIEWTRKWRWKTMALVIGKERALRLKRFLSTTNEEELLQRHNREIDLRLWQRFAADVEAEGASLKDRGEDRAGAMPPYIIHPHSKWKTSWDIFIVAMVVLHTCSASGLHMDTRARANTLTHKQYPQARMHAGDVHGNGIALPNVVWDQLLAHQVRRRGPKSERTVCVHA